MKKENEFSLDNSKIASLLSLLETAIYNKDKDSVKNIDKSLSEVFKIIDKEKLITKFIQINGETLFNRLKVETLEDYYKTLPIVIRMSDEYTKDTNDFLYLIAQISIITDWYLYNKINLIIE